MVWEPSLKEVRGHAITISIHVLWMASLLLYSEDLCVKYSNLWWNRLRRTSDHRIQSLFGDQSPVDRHHPFKRESNQYCFIFAVLTETELTNRYTMELKTLRNNIFNYLQICETPEMVKNPMLNIAPLSKTGIFRYWSKLTFTFAFVQYLKYSV